MINLRYHIVSLTAVFLAMGIGLTLGSTFLDRATVDNLNAQLQSLEGRLGERDQVIADLEDQLARIERTQGALDEQGFGLLAGQLDAVPVVVMSSEGVDAEDVDGAIRALLVAGADVRGQWHFTDRFLLADGAAVTDLAAALGVDYDDPARLRRTAIAELGAALRDRQDVPDDGAAGDQDAPPEQGPAGGDQPLPDEEGPTSPAEADDVGAGEPSPAEPTEGEADDDRAPLPLVDALIEAGFIEFEAVSGGGDTATFPLGTRVVVVGGSPDVPDDVVAEPLIERLTAGATEPVPVVAGSAMVGDGISDLVSVIREDERLRSLVATVDSLEHFQDWAALVLAVADVDDGVVGHYGIGEGASRLLPPLRTP